MVQTRTFLINQKVRVCPDKRTGNELITKYVIIKYIFISIMDKLFPFEEIGGIAEFSQDPEEIITQYRLLKVEADTVRENDKVVIRSLLGDFYGKQLEVGIGFERAWGSILSGDYFELFKLPDGNYLFVFADISGHGLPAYTTLVRLRCAVIVAVKGYHKHFTRGEKLNAEKLIRNITTLFTDLMEVAGSKDFASVLFTLITSEDDKYHLQFFNRGMYFPLVVRRFQDELIDVYDLNESEKGWLPVKGFLLSSELRELLGEKYNEYNSCTFILYEGDSLLYTTDGILEAKEDKNGQSEYGMDRLKNRLIRHIQQKTLTPQEVINRVFDDVYRFMGKRRNQHDDMTAVLINLPLVR